MTAPAVAVPEADRVETWRRDRSLELGYTITTATWIAVNAEIDWHDLAALIAAGCPRLTAIRILAP